ETTRSRTGESWRTAGAVGPERSTAQTRTVRSFEPVASLVPSGEKAQQTTGPEWPAKVATSSPVPASQTRAGKAPPPLPRGRPRPAPPRGPPGAPPPPPPPAPPPPPGGPAPPPGPPPARGRATGRRTQPARGGRSPPPPRGGG